MQMRKERAGTRDWQKADARVLGQLLAAQNIDFVLPDTIHIAEFYNETLKIIPGIQFCCVCLENTPSDKGCLGDEICKECQAQRRQPAQAQEPLAAPSTLRCPLADQSGIQIIPINSLHHFFGFFVFTVDQPETYRIYQPFIGNLANYLAISLENRLQRDQLQQAHHDLERKVEERTHDLVTTNAHLREEIEQRRRLEEALAASERQIKELVNASPVAMAVVSEQEERFEWVNHKFVELFGYTSEEVVDLEHWWLFAYPDQAYRNEVIARCWNDQVKKAVHAREQIEPMEAMVTCKDGSQHYITFGLSSIGARYIVTFVDLTERRQAEEAIRQLNQNLEKRVADRTAELEAVNKELEAFAYSVSHDLRAPLRHIDGFLELLDKRIARLLDEPSQRYMTIISDSAKRMGVLIDDLLSFSRMGRYEMSKTPIDLNRLIEEVLHELEPETRDRHILWQIAKIPVVSGDRAMLKVVLMNLLSNALKFTSHREQAEIVVGCTRQGTAELVLFIQDNGVGFDMAYADKLFGVFQRLHREDEFEGTGIGLATVRRIITRHGGRTWAEGEVDHGATFYLSLPLLSLD